MVFLKFLNFLLFFWNFLFLVEQGRNRTLIFFFSLSQPFPSYLGLKWSHNCIFWFFWIFFSFFGIFYYQSDRKGTEWQFLFFLFLGIFQPISAWNEATMVFFYFFYFFSLFLEFYISRRVRTERKDNFCFLSFSSFSNLFWLEMGFFFIFFLP